MLTLDLIFWPASILSRQKEALAWQPEATDEHGSDRQPRETTSPWTQSVIEQTKAHRFVQAAIKKDFVRYGGSCATAVKLLMPAVSGYVVRDDIVQRRFLTCQLAEEVADFTTAGKLITAFDYVGGSVLEESLNTAAGAIHLKRPPAMDQMSVMERALASLEVEVQARLTFSWIVSRPLPRRRIALINGRGYPGPSTVALIFYRAAKALGVKLVVVDHAGQWAQSAAAGEWRDEFIACDLTIDDGLPTRIVNALSKSEGPIHNITTYTDQYVPAVAKAAEKLGLYTNPSGALDICHDKQRTREATSPDLGIISVGGLKDLEAQFEHRSLPLQYPLILKPAIGVNSGGVSIVSSMAELTQALQRHEKKFTGLNAVVEPYISGPEVDANFVLLDGELIFSEINDDFPSPGETQQGKLNHFAEVSTIMPSLLPQAEISLLESTLTGQLLKLGFRNGVFHVEARVKNSKMTYAVTDNGTELVPRPTQQIEASEPAAPSVFLVEINPRPPGHQVGNAVEYTYGIDYFALHLLAALSPIETPAPGSQLAEGVQALKEITHALSLPLPPDCRYPTHVVLIPLTRGGTFVAAMPLPEALAQYVVESEVFMQSGQVCADPETEGRWPFVAYLVVAAKVRGVEGRLQARTIGERVRDAFEYVME